MGLTQLALSEQLNMSHPAPSEWVKRHAHRFPAQGRVLDVAAGSGRNARWLAEQGLQVSAIDRDATAMDTLSQYGIHAQVHDLEAAAWPFPAESFDAIIVCRYLYRPIFPYLIYSLNWHGVLIVETFMQGQESYGRPSNPDFLLRPGELEEWFANQMQVISFEQGLLQQDPPAMIQRICCIKTPCYR